MKPVQLTAAYFFRNGNQVSMSRFRITPRTPRRSYTRDFAEVFWVESGTGTHVVNGQRQPLLPGTLVLLRPNDCHEFHVARGTPGLMIVTFLFPPATLAYFRERYFRAVNIFFWATTPLPFTVQLNAAEVKWLAVWHKTLFANWSDQMMSDRFLLELLTKFRPLSPASPAATTAPAWLQQALLAVRQPQHFRGGTAAFARLAGHGSRHVNRTLHQHCGLTITEVVNQARVEYAAMELAMSDKKILDICLECGFPNLGHFYRVFKGYYKLTPRHYRQRQHNLAIRSFRE